MQTGFSSDTQADSLGDRIVQARERAGLSTAQLARRLGVKTRTLSSWEKNASEPRSNRLMMLAGSLNVSPLWLLNGTDEYAPNEDVADLSEMRERVASLQRVIESLSTMVSDLSDKVEQMAADKRAA